jgi:hypothetical protein
VIFTTAKLWTTQADIGSADLNSGDLPPETVKADPSDWIWFNHNRSAQLRPSIKAQLDGDRANTLFDIAKEMQSEYARSIAVVSVDYLDNFLMADLEEWLT